jgi:YhcH/YjgK/YiaL family protein
MIVDKIENSKLYAAISQRLAKALDVLKKEDFSNAVRHPMAEKADGRYDIDGSNLYYLVQRYQTKPADQCKLEAHKDYIDIQFVADGEEILAYTPLDNLEIATPYNKEKDIIFYKTPANISSIVLTAGIFCVLFPDDAHMPKCRLKSPSNLSAGADVLKIVVKVKI